MKKINVKLNVYFVLSPCLNSFSLSFVKIHLISRYCLFMCVILSFALDETNGVCAWLLHIGYSNEFEYGFIDDWKIAALRIFVCEHTEYTPQCISIWTRSCLWLMGTIFFCLNPFSFFRTAVINFRSIISSGEREKNVFAINFFFSF